MESAREDPGRPLRVWLVDPSCFSPYYDLALVDALGRAGAGAALLTAEFIYDPALTRSSPRVRRHFFRMCALPGLRQLCLRWERLRYLIKAIEYPLDWLAALPRLALERPDILHFQWVVHPAVDRWILRALRALRVPIVYTAHNLVPHSSPDRRIRPALAAVYRAADRILVHTEGMRQELAAQLPDVGDRIGLVGHGLLHEGVAEMPQSAARQRLGIPAEARVILFLGALSIYKGLDTLVAAFEQVARDVPGSLLLVVGPPDEAALPYLERLRTAEFAHQVKVRAEFVPIADLPVYYGAADLVALPYRGVSQSGALLTAFRYGVPVVTSDAGAFCESFDQGVHGLRVPVGDAAAFAAATTTILTDPGLGARMREDIRALCATRYSWEPIAAATLDHYRAVRSRPGPGREASRA